MITLTNLIPLQQGFGSGLVSMPLADSYTTGMQDILLEGAKKEASQDCYDLAYHNPNQQDPNSLFQKHVMRLQQAKAFIGGTLPHKPQELDADLMLQLTPEQYIAYKLGSIPKNMYEDLTNPRSYGLGAAKHIAPCRTTLDPHKSPRDYSLSEWFEKLLQETHSFTVIRSKNEKETPFLSLRLTASYLTGLYQAKNTEQNAPSFAQTKLKELQEIASQISQGANPNEIWARIQNILSNFYAHFLPESSAGAGWAHPCMVLLKHEKPDLFKAIRDSDYIKNFESYFMSNDVIERLLQVLEFFVNDCQGFYTANETFGMS